PPVPRHPSSPLFPYTTLFRSYLSPASICSSISRHAVNPSLGARRRRSATAPALLYLRDAGPPHPWRSPVGDGLEILLQTLANFRSEEHTSELQSRENLVCRLL